MSNEMCCCEEHEPAHFSTADRSAELVAGLYVDRPEGRSLGLLVCQQAGKETRSIMSITKRLRQKFNGRNSLAGVPSEEKTAPR